MNKLRLLCLFPVVVCCLAFLSPVPAQTRSGGLRGEVLDPTGAVVPGAVVTLTQSGQVFTSTSGATGNYVFRTLPLGQYSLTVAAKQFAPLSMPVVTIAPGETKELNLSLAIAVQKQQVTVEGQARTVSVSPDQNANATILQGSALDALSDDPDELQNELQELAGPAAGPNGGQIYIDGFEGGQIPPKSDILQIRVNQNPFSAEYDRIGYGRIEIITKPGTQKLHGRVSSFGNDSAFNTANPLIANQPSYYRYGFFGNASGPISKTATWFFNATRFDSQNQTIIDALNPQNPAQNLKESYPSPLTYLSLGPRIDFAIGKNNMFTAREAF
ncbi:MAG TPA: carboxypeptidase regulatory-like domain-containing protein, partial [Terracidiphilus sp.]|nr:carboxypeptidase regulatory-like domain-containing protein [Terracidiphilus sp.]